MAEITKCIHKVIIKEFFINRCLVVLSNHNSKVQTALLLFIMFLLPLTFLSSLSSLFWKTAINPTYWNEMVHIFKV